MDNKNLNTNYIKDAVSTTIKHIELTKISTRARLRLMRYKDKSWELVFELEKDIDNYGMGVFMYDIGTKTVSVKVITFDKSE